MTNTKEKTMRNNKGQFRSAKPTTEEAQAILLLVKAGFLKLEVS